jgi:transposase-like protein
MKQEELVMSRIHPVECDRCEKPMLFQNEVKDHVQDYRCPKCKRRGLAHLNSQGGVMYVEYTDKSHTMLVYHLANLVGAIIRDRKK